MRLRLSELLTGWWCGHRLSLGSGHLEATGSALSSMTVVCVERGCASWHYNVFDVVHTRSTQAVECHDLYFHSLLPPCLCSTSWCSTQGPPTLVSLVMYSDPDVTLAMPTSGTVHTCSSSGVCVCWGRGYTHAVVVLCVCVGGGGVHTCSGSAVCVCWGRGYTHAVVVLCVCVCWGRGYTHAVVVLSVCVGGGGTHMQW